jgi:Calx-beta domain/FG-GAP-like repeat/Bacterial Ig domain
MSLAAAGVAAAQTPSGLFQPYVNYPTGGFAEAVAIGDVTGDGRNDVVMVVFPYGNSVNDNSVLVFPQQVNGSLGAPVRYLTCTGPQKVAIGDISGDGRNDVVVGCQQWGPPPALTIHRQTATGLLSSADTRVMGSTPTVLVADFTGDGRADIAYSASTELGVIPQLADGSLGTPQVQTYAGSRDLKARDMNGDGLIDVVATVSRLQLALFTQNAGALAAPVMVPLPAGATDPVWGGNGLGLALGDFTGDSLPDAAVAWGGNRPTSNLTLYPLVSGATQSGTPSTFASYDIPSATAAADVTGDGRDDVLVVHLAWSRVGVYVQSPGGGFQSERLDPAPTQQSNFQALAVGDFNGDQLPDIALAGHTGGLSVLLHTPDPAPVVTVSSPTGSAALLPGSNVTVSWSAADNGTVEEFDVEFAVDGSTFSPVAGCSGLPGSTTSCSWVVPDVSTGQGRIRVSARDDKDSVGTGLSAPLLVGIGVSIADVTIPEGATASAVITLTSPATSPLTVTYGTEAGTAGTADYVSASATVVIPAGASGGLVPLTALEDTVDEAVETFAVRISVSSGASVTRPLAIVSILDNDPPRVSVSDGMVGAYEGSPLGFTISLSSAHDSPVTVGYEAVPGTAGSNDFTPVSGTVVFAPGVTSQAVAVETAADMIDEDGEIFFLNLTSVSGGTFGDSQGVGTLLSFPVSIPSISITGAALTEGSGDVQTSLAVALSAPSDKMVSVAYSTDHGTAIGVDDFAPASGQVVFLPGQTVASVPISVKGDSILEPTETFRVNLAGPINATLGGQSTGIVTIFDDDQERRLTISDPAVGESLTSVNFVVSLNLPLLSPLTVSYATAVNTAKSGDFAARTGSVTFAAGETSKIVTITLRPDLIDEPDETFFVNLTPPAGVVAAKTQGVATIVDDDEPPSLSISDASVTEANSGWVTMIFTIRLSAVSGHTVAVTYATQDGTATAPADYAAKAGSVQFAPGVVSRTVTVSIKGDVLAEETETLQMVLSSPTLASLSRAVAIGTIMDNDPL